MIEMNQNVQIEQQHEAIRNVFSVKMNNKHQEVMLLASVTIDRSIQSTNQRRPTSFFFLFKVPCTEKNRFS